MNDRSRPTRRQFSRPEQAGNRHERREHIPAARQMDENGEDLRSESQDAVVIAAEPGEVAWLKVISVNNTGAFLYWGKPKDLLLPYGEQNGRVVVGQHCLVCILLDSDDRPFATMKLDNWIHDTVAEGDEYDAGAAVNLIIAEETDLGVKAVVNHRYWGLLYRDEIFRTLSRGQQLRGYIKKQREDGKIDITLNPPNYIAAQTLADRILAAIDAAGGKLALTDKSSPADIQRAFGVSKSVFKQAIGALYKQRQIEITSHGIRRTENHGDAAR